MKDKSRDNFKEVGARWQMSVMSKLELEQDRSMALVLTEETRRDRLERIISDLITELGFDLADQHFEGTPARVARLYRELTRGPRVDPAKIYLAVQRLTMFAPTKGILS